VSEAKLYLVETTLDTETFTSERPYPLNVATGDAKRIVTEGLHVVEADGTHVWYPPHRVVLVRVVAADAGRQG